MPLATASLMLIIGIVAEQCQARNETLAEELARTNAKGKLL